MELCRLRYDYQPLPECLERCFDLIDMRPVVEIEQTPNCSFRRPELFAQGSVTEPARASRGTAIVRLNWTGPVEPTIELAQAAS